MSHLTQQEIAERNGYKDREKIILFKKTVCGKIAELAKIPHEELQAADLDFLVDYKKHWPRPLITPCSTCVFWLRRTTAARTR